MASSAANKASMLIQRWSALHKLELFAFGIWLCLSVLRQVLRPCPRWLSLLDRYRMIPGWHLFAPRVASYDYKLFIRDHRKDGTLSEWLDFTPLPQRRWWTSMWNPSRRIRKVFFADTRGLMKRVAAEESPRHSREYRCLARYAVMCHDSGEASGRQFLLTASREHQVSPERLLVFKSDFIPLTEESASKAA